MRTGDPDPGSPRPASITAGGISRRWFSSTVVEVGGMLDVTLTSGKVQIAVFRVRNDGQLKRLVRVPAELKQEE